MINECGIFNMKGVDIIDSHAETRHNDTCTTAGEYHAEFQESTI